MAVREMAHQQPRLFIIIITILNHMLQKDKTLYVAVNGCYYFSSSSSYYYHYYYYYYKINLPSALIIPRVKNIKLNTDWSGYSP